MAFLAENVLMVASILMLSRITELENLETKMSYKDGNITWASNDSAIWYTPDVLEEQEQALTRLNDFLDENGLISNLRWLGRKIGQEICERIGMQIAVIMVDGGSQNETKLDLCGGNELDVSWIGKSFICYRLPLNNFVFDTRDDYAQITVNLRGLYPRWFEFLKLHIGRYGRAPALWFDLQGTAKYDEASDLAIPIGLGRMHHASLEVSGVYDSIEREDVCQVQTTQSECEEGCFAESLLKMCPNCYPFSRFAVSESQSGNPSEADYATNSGGRRCNRKCRHCNRRCKPTANRHCTIDDYKQCLDFDPKNVKACTKKCKRNCHQITFRINWKEFADIPGKEDPNGTAYSTIRQKLSIHTFVYPQFRESTTLTFQGLVADVGGIVGLWIGCSLITLIHLFIFICYEGALCCMGKRARVEEAKKRATEEAKIEADKQKATELVDEDEMKEVEEEEKKKDGEEKAEDDEDKVSRIIEVDSNQD